MQIAKCFVHNEEAARDKKEILGTWIQICSTSCKKLEELINSSKPGTYKSIYWHSACGDFVVVKFCNISVNDSF